MEIEHFALNVPDPAGMARWYVRHLGMRIVMGLDKPPYTHFLADGPGHVMLEIYRNEADAIPDYSAQHHLRVHVAFSVEDPHEAKRRLLAAGATAVEDVQLPDGGFLATLRDPWGLAIQVCRRGKPLI